MFALRILMAALCLGSSVLAFAGEAEAKLPEGINALPNDLARRIGGLVGQTEKFRGLRCLHGVAKGSLEVNGLRKKMLEAFAEEMPESKMRPLEASLKQFGFIPETMDLAKYYPELLTSQVGGYYDPRRKYLVIVQKEGGLLGKEAAEKYGKEVAERLEDTVMVHEICHAIQDQHFNLQKLAIEDPLSDEAAGRLALIEGDATLTMYSYFSGMPLEEMPGVERVMKQMFEDPAQLMEMAPDMPGSKEMAEAPAWFRDNLLFSYMQGFVFALNVKKLGGQKLLDHAFKNDPPKSTEQILHPEKWHTLRDDPIQIVWPDLALTLPGHKKVAEGQLGEQSTMLFLREVAKSGKSAGVGADGWGGDRFAVYQRDGKNVLLWITEWDTEKDAEQFSAEAKKLPAGWRTEAASPMRVIVSRGELNEAEVAGVKKTLGEAKAVLPENKAMDLAALGIDARALAQKAPKKDLLQGIAEQLQEGGEVDLGKLLNDDKLKDLTEQLGGAGEAGKDAKGNNPNLGELLKDPAMQDMVKKMLSEERPKGAASADGRGYTNDKLGFKIRLPDEAKDWKLNATPPPPMAVIISDPSNEAQVTVVSQNMPFALPIEQMGPMLEMGPKMAMQNYKKIESKLIEVSGKKGWEMQYEGTANGEPLRSTQRVFLNGGTMLVLSAISNPARWAKHEATLNAALKAFEFTAPAAPAGVKKE